MPSRSAPNGAQNMIRGVPFLVLAWLCVLAGPAAHAGPLALGTMSPGTASYASGAVIGRVLHERQGLSIGVHPYGGETVLMALLETAELDFAIASVIEAGDAFAGRGAYAGAPQTRLRVAAVLFPLQVALFVRADSDIHRLADLAGRRVASGFAAMASIDRMRVAILANGGLDADAVVPVPVPNVMSGAEQFLAGRADAFFFAIGAAMVREVEASVRLRVLPLDDDRQALARMRAVFADGYPSRVVAAPGLAGVSAPTSALTFDNLLLSAEHVRARTVANVLGALAGHTAELGAGFAPLGALGADRLLKPGLPLPLHDGALLWQQTRAAGAPITAVSPAD